MNFHAGGPFSSVFLDFKEPFEDDSADNFGGVALPDLLVGQEEILKAVTLQEVPEILLVESAGKPPSDHALDPDNLLLFLFEVYLVDVS